MEYTKKVLRYQYALHKLYVQERKKTGVRLPGMPEDISENIIKFILHSLGDTTSVWKYKNNGDLYSTLEGKQECKCFTSSGPISFTPVSEWDVIYFLDARRWLEDDTVTLYKCNLKRSSEEWKRIRVNKTQTFHEQCEQGRRPRICWDALHPQIEHEKVFEGNVFSLLSSKSDLQ
jgi:hypothetical protein